MRRENFDRNFAWFRTHAAEVYENHSGRVDSVAVETKIQFVRETGVPVSFRGLFPAVTDLTALDISVLGRDITDNFAAIVDRLANTVFFVGQRHTYSISEC